MGPLLVRGCGGGSFVLRLKPRRRQQHGLIHRFQKTFSPSSETQSPRAVEKSSVGSFHLQCFVSTNEFKYRKRLLPLTDATELVETHGAKGKKKDATQQKTTPAIIRL